ncbi:hypothetical protein [Roseibium sp.]|uniref:hypothetical protein n=1 Tax=Roseibium sp. TaxID=1936156 RepID=UPI003A983360
MTIKKSSARSAAAKSADLKPTGSDIHPLFLQEHDKETASSVSAAASTPQQEKPPSEQKPHAFRLPGAAIRLYSTGLTMLIFGLSVATGELQAADASASHERPQVCITDLEAPATMITPAITPDL